MFTIVMFFWLAFILSTFIVYAIFSNKAYFEGYPLTLKTTTIYNTGDIVLIAVKWFMHSAIMTVILSLFCLFLSNSFVELKQINFDYLLFWGWAIMFNIEVWVQIIEYIFTKTKKVDYDSYSGVV